MHHAQSCGLTPVAQLLALASARDHEMRCVTACESASTQREIARIKVNSIVQTACIQADLAERQSMIHALATNMHAKINADPYRDHYAGSIREHGCFGKGYTMQIEAW